MTSFETEVYNREGENVIGARVIVSADNGQTIDEIQVTNKTQFDELKGKLDTLNEDYTQFDEGSPLKGLTLDSILANEDETVNINALTLNGFKYDQFSKANHNHYKATILDLYNYDISLSQYNANYYDSVTVTVRVTDTKGSSVKNHNVIIYKNNAFWKTGTTNANGIFSTTFDVFESGLITFSCNNQKVQLLCKKWDYYTAHGRYHGDLHASYSDDLGICSCRIVDDSFDGFASSTGRKYLFDGEAVLPEKIRPLEVVRAPTYRGDVVIQVGTDGKISAYSPTKFSNISIRNTLMWYYGDYMEL